jgi:quercetin dioxygenase-like cupin family protein
MQRLLILGLTVTAMIAASPAQSKAMKWMDGSTAGLPAGAKIAVVSGDPSKDGSNFVIRAKLPANYAVPPHHHPGDETVRVLGAGTLTYGMGDKVNTASSASLTKGYHVTMQAGMNHWASNTDPVEIQVSGKGPFGIIYVNPADDPRKK